MMTNVMTNPVTAQQPLIKPIMQLGPDSLHMLRSISKEQTGDRFTYDNARVQRNRWGAPSIEINFGKLEMLEAGHSDSYGVFISRRVVPEAFKQARRLKKADPTLLKYSMGILLKKALTEDTEVWWQLSANPLRSILFPAAYEGNKRTDRIFYYALDGYKRQLGLALWLRSLSPKDVHDFHIKAAAAVPTRVFDAAIITPLLNTTQKV